SEGAEVQIQVLANTLLYNLWEFRHDTLARVGLRGADKSKFGLADSDLGLTMAGLWLGELALRGTWQTFAKILGLTHHVLPDMDEVAAISNSHYNVELRGGEGHLEVGKLILNVVHQKAHMTLSVKPFGCMPSSGVSDGVQSMITEMYPDAIFCPVETSGDGAVNFYSRVQMFLFKAKQRAQAEFEAVCEEEGVTPEQLRNFARGTRYEDFRYVPPHRKAGTAADFVHDAGPLAKAGLIGRTKIHTQRALAAVKHELFVATPKRARAFADVAPYLPALVRFGATQAKDAVPSWNSFIERFVGQTEAERADVARAEAAMQNAPAPSAQPERTLSVVA
ncbi:MAG: 2-hydroxyglutaryl-CoA dehydratase, partial [Deltaproteobacteria bacterium]|nr:2-hydroxyglutaryl-CoA dehydratase [Deltaproteobacteria bacterium]